MNPQPPPDGAGDELREAVHVLYSRYVGRTGGMHIDLTRSQEHAVKDFIALARPAPPAAEPVRTTVLPDGSGFFIGSLPLPKDHWLYAPRAEGWDDKRDTSPDQPHPILSHASRKAVIEAVRYAVRAATMCGAEKDFDPDALVQNAVVALCGPYGVVQPLAPNPAAQHRDAIEGLPAPHRRLCPMSDPKPAFAAAPPSADLQEAMTFLRKVVSHFAPDMAARYYESAARHYLPEFLALLRRLSQPAHTSETAGAKATVREVETLIRSLCSILKVQDMAQVEATIDRLHVLATPPPPAGSRDGKWNPSERGTVCVWIEDCDGIWHSEACGMEGWCFPDGGRVADNGMIFCHHCGHPIADVPFDDGLTATETDAPPAGSRPEDAGLQRFNPDISGEMGCEYAVMEPDPAGEWVRYSEAASRIEALSRGKEVSRG